MSSSNAERLVLLSIFFSLPFLFHLLPQFLISFQFSQIWRRGEGSPRPPGSSPAAALVGSAAGERAAIAELARRRVAAAPLGD